ncbi:Hypothetical protein D9617_18g033860 [Elsinoe fawcettii]|nr:Hypothetical protein D9617_18g033860 [Elsinoe fawcettii]
MALYDQIEVLTTNPALENERLPGRILALKQQEKMDQSTLSTMSAFQPRVKEIFIFKRSAEPVECFKMSRETYITVIDLSRAVAKMPRAWEATTMLKAHTESGIVAGYGLDEDERCKVCKGDTSAAHDAVRSVEIAKAKRDNLMIEMATILGRIMNI